MRNEFARLARAVDRLGGPRRAGDQRERIALERTRYAAEPAAPHGNSGAGRTAERRRAAVRG